MRTLGGGGEEGISGGGGSLSSSFLKRLRYQSGADDKLMQCFSL